VPTILIAGLTMVVFGGRVFLKREQPKARVADEETLGRMCPPTFGEMIEIDLLTRKLGSLAIAAAGAAVAYGSLLSLVRKREHS